MKHFFLSFIFTLSCIFSFSAFAHEDSQNKEAEYLIKMNEHHKSGVEMAELALKKSENKEVKQIAQKIKAQQSKEIKKMTSWKKSWYPKVEVQPEMSHMDMNELKSSEGKVFDQKFLTMMSDHHQQAISMIDSSLPDLKHKENKKMAEMMQKTQTAEIEKMRALEKSLK